MFTRSAISFPCNSPQVYGTRGTGADRTTLLSARVSLLIGLEARVVVVVKKAILLKPF